MGWFTYHVSFGGSFDGDFGVGVNGEAGVKHAITDLIAEFVGVSLAHRLGGKVKVPFLVFFHLFDWYCYWIAEFLCLYLFDLKN